jgi:cobalt/nickel transport system permease protein
MTFKLHCLPTGDSIFGRLDARWSLAAFLILVVAVACLHHLATAALALAGSLVLALASRLPWRWFVTRLAPVAGFLAVALVLLPLLSTEFSAPATKHALQLAIIVCLKALAIVILVLVLLAACGFTTLLKAGHRLRAPGLVVQVAALAHRYAFVLASELARLRVALRVRGYRNRASRHSYRTVGHVAGTLLVRGYERADRVGHAMRCRGFQGRFHTLGEFRTRAADVAFFLILASSAAALLFWDFSL